MLQFVCFIIDLESFFAAEWTAEVVVCLGVILHSVRGLGVFLVLRRRGSDNPSLLISGANT